MKTRNVVEIYYNGEWFNQQQYKQIQLGFENGLTEKQIAVYANPKFNIMQMRQIRFGFYYGLPDKQISIYAQPVFNQYQMRQIRMGLIDELDVSVYANPKLTASEMEKIRTALYESKILHKQISKLQINQQRKDRDHENVLLQRKRIQ